MKPEEKDRYLSAIEATEGRIRLDYEELLSLQHQYLEASGFLIKTITCDEEHHGYTYSIDDEIFICEEQAIEWLEEQGE